MVKTKTIAVADCETDPFEYGKDIQPFIWGYYDGKDYLEFVNTKDFIKHVSAQNVTVYAHNGGKFDWHFLADYIEPYKLIMVINGRLAKFKIGNAEFRDSYNILPTPLAAFAKQEFEYWKLKKENRQKYWKEIQRYLESDCLNLYSYISKFIEMYGKHLTLASAAMKQWEKINGKVEQTTDTFYELFSRFYYGGRVQCFQSGIIKDSITIADINSAYPHAMMSNHPSGKEFLLRKKLPNNPKTIQRSFIELECKSYGAFPVRTKSGLNFPYGEYGSFFVTGWEYKKAVDLNLIDDITIKQVFTFPKKIKFNQYINEFFKLKQEAKENGDKAGYIFAKLFLNSLYGKFAANPDKYSEYILSDHDTIRDMSNDGFTYTGQFGKWALLEKPLSESKRRFFNVATAASITGFVRAQLLEAIHSVDNPLYCDTDSIAFTGGSKIPIGQALGEWDIEGKAIEGAIAGKKLYTFKLEDGTHKTASKGARLNPDQIRRIAKGEIIKYKSENPTFSMKKGKYYLDREIKITV